MRSGHLFVTTGINKPSYFAEPRAREAVLRGSRIHHIHIQIAYKYSISMFSIKIDTSAPSPSPKTTQRDGSFLQEGFVLRTHATVVTGTPKLQRILLKGVAGSVDFLMKNRKWIENRREFIVSAAWRARDT
jgi:hypothetical protein